MKRKLLVCCIWAICMHNIVNGMRCTKEFFYHQHYGYGYNIMCEKLNSESINELKDTSVYNEIKLTISSSNLTTGDWNLFGSLEKLREINIVNSTLNYDNEPLFKKLSYLNYLLIENNNFTVVFNNTFNELTNLRELSLIKNSLTCISTNAFKNLLQLKYLNLNQNHFKSMIDIPLCEANNMKRLYLQNNFIAEFPKNLTCLIHLDELYLDYNKIKYLNEFLLSLANIKILSVSYNYIETLGNLLRNLNQLRHLNLEGNYLTSLNDINFQNLRNIENMNLKNNKITHSTEHVFSTNMRLLKINLENNNISKIYLQDLSALENLIIAKNKIQSLHQFSNLKKLKFLDLASNNITEIQRHVFENLTLLEFLNLSDNNIGNNLLKDSFIGLESLLELHLRNNNISDICDDTFAPFSKLEILDLSRNKMLKLNSQSFGSLTNLKILNMSNNNLENLEHNTLQKLIYLKILDVGGNRLQSIEYSVIISELPSLQSINIRENLLSCEFLSKMIEYLKNNNISYTIYEEFRFDKENVAGIYCQETENKLKESLTNNAELLKELYNFTKTSNNRYEDKMNETILYIVCFVTLAFGSLSAASYKVYVYYRRRNYFIDELELIQRP